MEESFTARTLVRTRVECPRRRLQVDEDPRTRRNHLPRNTLQLEGLYQNPSQKGSRSSGVIVQTKVLPLFQGPRFQSSTVPDFDQSLFTVNHESSNLNHMISETDYLVEHKTILSWTKPMDRKNPGQTLFHSVYCHEQSQGLDYTTYRMTEVKFESPSFLSLQMYGPWGVSTH